MARRLARAYLQAERTTRQQTTEFRHEMGTFGVGQAPGRVEDHRPRTGRAFFCDDISPPGRAVAPFAARNIGMPATPERVWRAIRAAQEAGASP